MTSHAPPRLFLIDGYALVYRAFHAVGNRPLTTKRGENTSIPWGIANFLDRLRRLHAPEYLGWVHDAGKSDREVKFTGYKATRVQLEPSQRADFERGVERVEQLLSAQRVPLLALPGFEADDVIATLARQSAAAGIDTVVVSPDKDLLQLVRSGVRVLNPYHGKPGATTEKWYDETNAAERLGVPPAQVVDYLALVGDASDNIPGVKGIGDKGARDLLARWGSLDEIFAHIEEVTPPRAKTALQEHVADARLSRELVTVRSDLNIALDLEALKARDADAEALRSLYVELEFATLARTLPPGATPLPAGPAADTKSATYQLADTPAKVDALVASIRVRGSFIIDLTVELEDGAPPIPAPRRSRIVGIALTDGPDNVWYLPFRHRKAGEQKALALDVADSPPITNLPGLADPGLASLVSLLQDTTIAKVGHNAKASLLVLRQHGVELRGLVSDTEIASYLLDPSRRSHAVDTLAFDLLHVTVPTIESVCGKGKNQVAFAEAPVERARDYCCERAACIAQLQDLFTPMLSEQRLDALLRDLELPLIDVLADMEWTGVAIDQAWFASLKSRFAAERLSVERQIWDAAGEEFNINSTAKLREILFDRLALPVKKRTATGPSTDAEVLQQLADEGHALPLLLMSYREIAKLESTYIDALPLLVNPRTHRLHTSYSQTVAATGRLSSSDPNLQNIPVRTAVGRDIRRGFVPREGWAFVAADYSQIELRLLAHLSQDPLFVEAFRAGGDIHRQTAALIFAVDPGDVTAEMRARAKTINFATIYGQGPFSLSKQLRIGVDEAKAFIATYFERFAGVRKFLDESVAVARSRGYTETIFGRRRYIPELGDRNFNVRAFGERIAQNSPIQGSAADLIKRAMLRVAAAIRAASLESVMLLQVHDELVFEAPAQEVATLIPLVVESMTRAATLSVPLVVDAGTGPNWLESKAH